MIFEKGWELKFEERYAGLWRASVSDGTDEKPIPLLFEKDRVEVIEKRMGEINLKESTFNLFRLIVTGCIKICCRY